MNEELVIWSLLLSSITDTNMQDQNTPRNHLFKSQKLSFDEKQKICFDSHVSTPRNHDKGIWLQVMKQ